MVHYEGKLGYHRSLPIQSLQSSLLSIQPPQLHLLSRRMAGGIQEATFSPSWSHQRTTLLEILGHCVVQSCRYRNMPLAFAFLALLGLVAPLPRYLPPANSSQLAWGIGTLKLIARAIPRIPLECAEHSDV